MAFSGVARRIVQLISHVGVRQWLRGEATLPPGPLGHCRIPQHLQLLVKLEHRGTRDTCGTEVPGN